MNIPVGCSVDNNFMSEEFREAQFFFCFEKIFSFIEILFPKFV